jgi:hypothetical protein
VWQDDRLSHESPEPRRTALASIWHPRIAVYNARQVTRGLPEEATITGNGLVRYAQRFSGTFTAPLDLHSFPKDEQLLQLRFALLGIDPNQVELTIIDEMTSQADEFTIADWHVEKGLGHIEPIELTETLSRPGVAYRFKATRDVQYYHLKIISTLILIVLMSWSAFWMKIGDVAPKLAMGASSMLTLIAYRSYLSGLVPRISYMTLMDYFVMGSTVLVSATLVGSLLINYQHQKGRNEAAIRIQFWSRIAFPVALAIMLFALEFSSR